MKLEKLRDLDLSHSNLKRGLARNSRLSWLMMAIWQYHYYCLSLPTLITLDCSIMGEMTTEQQIQLCNQLARLSADELRDIIYSPQPIPVSLEILRPSYNTGADGSDKGDNQEPKKPQDPIGIIIECLNRNSKAVREIISKHHNDIATMVYSLGLVVGNQLIASGDVNKMTIIYTAVMYLAKVGLDKVLTGSNKS